MKTRDVPKKERNRKRDINTHISPSACFTFSSASPSSTSPTKFFKHVSKPAKSASAPGPGARPWAASKAESAESARCVAAAAGDTSKAWAVCGRTVGVRSEVEVMHYGVHARIGLGFRFVETKSNAFTRNRCVYAVVIPVIRPKQEHHRAHRPHIAEAQKASSGADPGPIEELVAFGEIAVPASVCRHRPCWGPARTKSQPSQIWPAKTERHEHTPPNSATQTSSSRNSPPGPGTSVGVQWHRD